MFFRNNTNRTLQAILVTTIFFLVAGIILAVVLFGSSLFPPSSPSTSGLSQNIPNNVIAHENTRLGTTAWKISNREASTQIQTYADATSVQPGQKLTFYVSTQIPGTHYSIDIYRLGWYDSAGGRLMTSIVNQPGQAQGYYQIDPKNPKNNRLVACSTCHIDTQTALVEANWHPSYSLTIPSDWVTGIYLAKFTDANGWQTYTPFDLRGNTRSAYVAVTADTTYAAYNNWGGSSLYEADGVPPAAGEEPQTAQGTKVSFDRPYVQENGSSQVLIFETDAIHWMESKGYDLSYISSVDLQTDPGQLLNHHAYLSLGHDEYWTKEMRDGVEQARDHGVGLAFLGADAAYWQMRFEPDSAGHPNRTVICYKVATNHNDLFRDPMYGQDITRVTALWRDPVLHRPENALIGIMFSDLTHKQNGFPWQVSSSAPIALLRETGLTQGHQYGCGLVGYEWDRDFHNANTPKNVQILGTSQTVGGTFSKDQSNTTYYIAPSGAMVFATGSIYWSSALDGYRLHTDPACRSQATVIPGMQHLMEQVMSKIITTHPAGV